jgi:2'-5' RNA ligase
MEVTIVALPTQEDPVNKYSSEKKAHLTLLYLGEVSPESAAKIIAFVEHASTMMRPFGLSVDYRGELGADQADVLFFEKNWTDRIAAFRANLLANNVISLAYNSVEQYPEWTPHLTMGYPESPAKEDDREYPGFNWIQFDRIAVWVGDFDGPEFRLRDDRAMEVAMSDTQMIEAGAEFLEHFGVKGMHWGVRKSEGGAPKERGKIRKAITRANVQNRAINETIREKGGGPLLGTAEQKHEFRVNVHSDTAWAVGNLKNDPRFKGKDLKYDHEAAAAYSAEVKKAAATAYKNQLAIHRTKLAIDTTVAITKAVRQAKAEEKARAEEIRIKATEAHAAAHAEDGNKVLDEMVMSFSRDDKGFITDLTVEEELSHTEAGADFLEHYGVKGMRWGVTTVDKATRPTVKREGTSRAAKKGPEQITVTQSKPGRLVKSKGGSRHGATDEAVKAQAARQKAKRSTTDSLSNDELRTATERMRLEREFRTELKKQERISVGRQFVDSMLSAKAKVDQLRGKTKNN